MIRLLIAPNREFDRKHASRPRRQTGETNAEIGVPPPSSAILQ
jgi:hypothetical protein